MTRLLLLLILLTSFQWLTTKAQDADDQWNMREKDRITESIRAGKTYTGLIKPKYEFMVHQVIPEPDTVTHILLSVYDSVVCKYVNNNATNVVQNIFEDLANDDASACTRSYRSPKLHIQTTIGHKNEKLVTAVNVDRNTYALAFLENDNDFKIYDELPTNNIPLAVLDDATLLYAPSKNELYITKGQQTLPVDISSIDVFANDRFRRNMVKVFDNHIYTHTEVNDKMSLVQIDPETGNAEIINETGILSGISSTYTYILEPEGLSRTKTGKKKKELLISSAVFELMEIPSFLIPDEEDDSFYFSTGNGIGIIDMSFFDALDIGFEEYELLEKEYKQMNQEFKEMGIYPWDYEHIVERHDDVADAAAETESEAAVDAAVAEEAVETSAVAVEEDMGSAQQEKPNAYEEEEQELPELNEKQKRMVASFLELQSTLGQKRRNINDILQNEIETSGKVTYGYLPEGYHIQQHPIDKTMMFIPENPEFPVLHADDLLMLDVD
jgi:hypothetical protein